MKTMLAVIGFLVAYAIPAFAEGNAAVHVISCPATIQTTQKLRAKAPSGWAQVSDLEISDAPARWENTHRFGGISFSTGHPSERVMLVPDNANEPSNGRAFTSYWTFKDTSDLYVTCSYHQTTVVLTQKVPNGYKRCEVRYEKKSAFEVVGASCSR